MLFKAFAFKAETVGEDGVFTGYGSVYNVVDDGGDMVIPGAFDQWLKEAGPSPSLPILWGHDGREVLGKYRKVESRELGLWLEGELNLDTVAGREKRSLLKQGAVSGLSIGYDFYPGGIRWSDEQKAYILSNLKLYEVSLVTFPMNRAARVETVKSAMACRNGVTVREIERALRELGVSTKIAKVAAKQTSEMLDFEADGESDDFLPGPDAKSGNGRRDGGQLLAAVESSVDALYRKYGDS